MLCQTSSCWSTLQSCSWCLTWDTSFFNYHSLTHDKSALPLNQRWYVEFTAVSCMVPEAKTLRKPIFPSFQTLGSCKSPPWLMRPPRGSASAGASCSRALFHLHSGCELLCRSHLSAVVTSSVASTESFGYQLLPESQSVKVWHEELLASDFPNLPLSCKSAFGLWTQVMSKLLLVLLVSTVRLPQDTLHCPCKSHEVHPSGK